MINTQYRVKTPPKNAKIPDVASRSLEALAGAIQQQYINAIFVNGVDSIIYIRRENGRSCTCQDIGISPVFQQGSTTLEVDGTFGRATLDSLLTGDDIVFRDPGGRAGDTAIDRHEHGPEDTVVFKDEMEPRTSDPDQGIIVPPTEENVNILPSGSSGCALCFGTGYVGGFDIHLGYRETLDVTLNPTLTNLSLDHTLNPHRLWKKSSSVGTATFSIILPKAAIITHSLKVWDNKELVSPLTYKLEISEGTWNTISATNLLTYCTGKPALIRLTTLVDDFRFSHVEIQVGYTSTPPKIDIPKFDEVLHAAVFEGIVGSPIILPPTLAKLNSSSMVRESLFGRIWRITNVRDWYDHRMNNHGYETTARLIQKYETSNILPGLASALSKPATAASSIFKQNARKFL